ncbi:MAG: hypothetical protein QXV98_00505 [Thermofilaceae archaeon]
MRRKAISGVVVAVLLTVVGIAAVLVFWGVISGLIGGRRLTGNIDSAQLLVVDNKAKLQVVISNVGTIDFTVNKISLDQGQVGSCNPALGMMVASGRSVTIVCDVSGVTAGSTYLLTVEIAGGGASSAILSSVYARQG